MERVATSIANLFFDSWLLEKQASGMLKITSRSANKNSKHTIPM
jgi:hypothetical protein